MLGIFQSRQYPRKEVMEAIAKFSDRHILPRFRSYVASELRKLVADWQDPSPIVFRPLPSERDASQAVTAKRSRNLLPSWLQRWRHPLSQVMLHNRAGLLDRLCGRKRGRDIHEVDSGEATVHDRHVTMMTAREENRPTRPSLRKTPRQNDDHLLYQCDLGVHIQVVDADRTGN